MVSFMDKLGALSDITKLNSDVDLNSANYKRMERTLDNLKGTKGKEGIKKAAEGFESLFVLRMLKEMRKTVPKSSLFGDSYAMDVFMSMFDEKLADQIAQSKSFGLGDMVVKYLEKKYQGEFDSKPENIPKTDEINKSPISNANPVNETMENRVNRFQSIIVGAAQHFNVDPALIKAVIAQESSGHPDAVSRSGAKGLMQLMDLTAQELDVNNIFDPKENIMGGVQYLKKLLEENNGDISLALASYNAGPGTVKLYNGIPPYAETRNYIQNVLKMKEQFQQQTQI